MLSRPRSVEREVARHLTNISEPLGYAPIYRIPVLGRTGPDLTTNELGLVVDVKSRIEVPKGIISKHICATDGKYFTCPIERLLEEPLRLEVINAAHSVTVDRWFNHMDEWRVRYMPQGITALILHRPKMPLGKAVLVISITIVEELCQKLQPPHSVGSQPINQAPITPSAPA